MSWLSTAMERGIRKGCERATKEFLSLDTFRQQVLAQMAKSPRLMFIKHMQTRYLQRCPELTDKQSFEAARDALSWFLESSKIAFGDADYGWLREDAFDLADADMEYWEAAA